MNLKFELDYWKKEGIKKGVEHQRKYCFAYLQLFEGFLQKPLQGMFQKATCAEIGPGPFGGMSLVLFPKQWVFIDPLGFEYGKLTEQNKKAVYINEQIEKVVALNMFIDAVFSTNALDHTEDRGLAIKRIYQMLQKESLFFLAVHCRTRKQLNAGHQQAFTGFELIKELENIGFKTINYSIIKDRLIKEQRQVYTTLVGIFKK
jgi:hypothetical protein